MTEALSLHEAIADLDEARIRQMPNEALRALVRQAIEVQQQDRKENQIKYYRPVSAMAGIVHQSQAPYICVGGGNRASKTDTQLAELTMLSTGQFSQMLSPAERAALRAKFRGPIAIRMVVESLTTTLIPVILPKLQFWNWNGPPPHGGERGHWGWIPRTALKQGNWAASWSAALRTLKVICRNPDDPDEVLGESVWQFMSFDQDPSDFASGEFHEILHDEPPPYPIWRENEARVMAIAGRMRLSMTWPDDPAIPVDWMFDQLYEPGRPGPNKDPKIDWFEMWTQDNPNIMHEGVERNSSQWTEAQREVKLFGRPIRFSNRVHPLFTDNTRQWCTLCNKDVVANFDCEKCKGSEAALLPFCHVTDFDAEPALPTVYLLDPHPRKPHMMLWAQIDSWDDIWVIAEALEPGGVEEVEAKVSEIENSLGLRVAARLGDPNMLASPASSKRGVTWRDEFDSVGLYVDLGDDSDAGRARLNRYLQPDPTRRAPRIHIHPRCVQTIKQLLRYTWDDFKHPEMHAQKQTPKTKDDDFPTLLKYLMNFDPRFENLARGSRVIQTRSR